MGVRLGDLLLKALALPVCLVIGSVQMAPAQEIELKLAWTSADSPTDPYAIGAHAFKDAIEERLPDRVSVALFPNRQLGDEKEMVEGLQFGTIEMAIITNAVVANFEPSFQVVDLPFLFADAKQAHEVLDGPIGETLAANLEDENVVLLGSMEGGFRNMINNVKPVDEPADVVGVKYRTMQNPVFIEMFQSLGGNAVPMAWGEVFTAMQQGTIDGLEIPAAVVNGNKFYEVTRYLSLTRHTYSAIHLLISKQRFESYPEDVQEAIREAGRVAVARQRETVAENERRVLEELEAAGMEINEVSDVAPFRQAVAPVYDEFRSSIGDELVDRVLAAVK